MGVANHLGIRIHEYDARIRTFIPWYEEIIEAAASALIAHTRRGNSLVTDLGIGSGALSARCAPAGSRTRVIGIDADTDMLALARKRLGARMRPVVGDFQSLPLPACDAIVASFALHHVRTAGDKAALYQRCFSALRPSGVLINADCCLASSPRLEARDRIVWRRHLERSYTRTQANAFLRAWAGEDVYFRLEDEMAMLRSAGFTIDVAWRRHCFAVIVGFKPPNTR